MKDPEHLERLIPKHGGYRGLRSFQAALAVYDGTVVFCDRFIDKRSRTHDQMVQAARSGVRNIEEGSVASGTSKKTELKLTNVARASLEELLRDYEDFLRHRSFTVWDKESPEARAVRDRVGAGGADAFPFRTAPPEVAANTLLCLINQASYLLRRQIERLERDFVEQGGFTERLYAVRTAARRKGVAADASDRSDRSDESDRSDASAAPGCPLCSKPMRLRTARQGANAGSQFWGCSGYPDCRGTRALL
jgi:four helix bundle suffix protein